MAPRPFVSLRAAVDLKLMGSRSVYVDCDVLQADGGTRTAAITGGWVALAHALRHLSPAPVRRHVAAISAGIVKGERLLDLAYAEDSQADADMNVVATDGGSLVEVQGTAEGLAFTKADLDALLEMALGGINKLVEAQKEAVRKF